MAKGGSSEWTTRTLLDYVDQRFIDQDKAVQAALTAADKAVQAALLAAKEAVTKAEMATEKRFDATNEFRGQLADQAASFMPRSEAELRFKSLAERTDANSSQIDKAGGGNAASQRAVTTILSGLAVLMALGAVIAIIVTHP